MEARLDATCPKLCSLPQNLQDTICNIPTERTNTKFERNLLPHMKNVHEIFGLVVWPSRQALPRGTRHNSSPATAPVRTCEDCQVWKADESCQWYSSCCGKGMYHDEPQKLALMQETSRNHDVIAMSKSNLQHSRGFEYPKTLQKLVAESDVWDDRLSLLRLRIPIHTTSWANISEVLPCIAWRRYSPKKCGWQVKVFAFSPALK